jgi:Na+/melibiose symporter-like transporter
VVVAFGGGMAFVLLGWFHYDVVHPKTNGPAANVAMLIVFAVVPTVLKFSSLAVLWRYPLDARRQTIVRRRLEQREARAHRAASLPPIEKAAS